MFIYIHICNIHSGLLCGAGTLTFAKHSVSVIKRESRGKGYTSHDCIHVCVWPTRSELQSEYCITGSR